MKKNTKRNRLILFLVAVVLIFIIIKGMTKRATGDQEELMMCYPVCDKSLLMGYDGEKFTDITLRYEWND